MNLRQSSRDYEIPHRLTYYECDELGHPTLSMVMSMFSVVGDEQSEQLGLTQEKVQGTGGSWVFTNFEGELNLQPLNIGDNIILGTRATSYNRFFATREFWLRDEKGNEYARVKALLVFMNLTTRKIQSIPDEVITPYQAPQVARMPRGKRPTQIADDAPVTTKDYHVRYFDIDANRHVNNARYFDWLLDPLGEKFLTSHQLTAFSIQYRQEVRADHDVNSEFIMKSPLNSCHQIKSNGELCTMAEFEWKENN